MTFTPLPGAIDFSAQTAESLQLLTTINVSINLPLGLDITPVVYPNLQALLFCWQADGANPLAPILAGVTFNGDTTTGPSLIADGASWICPLPSGLVTSVAGALASVSLQRPSGVANPLVGKLFVFGMMSNPLAVPVVRRAYVGAGASSGLKNAPPGNTAIVPTPAVGTYIRLKSLCFSYLTAPPATAAVIWQLSGAGTALFRVPAPPTANYRDVITLDLELDDGVTFNNGSTITIPCSATYEVWPV